MSNSADQLYSVCGIKDHLRNDCPKKGQPEYVNCSRAKRKDSKHEVYGRDCPDFQGQIELYNNRIEWCQESEKLTLKDLQQLPQI